MTEISGGLIENVDIPYKAIMSILNTLITGKQQGYKPGEWRNKSIHTHLGASIHHIGEYLRNYPNNTISDIKHLEHALCRLAFVVDMLSDVFHVPTI